ncbi:MAG TPA: hypothetical protein VGM23_02545 [Armatimonadota bacterium]|jgi:hypothetical protein
MVLNFGAIGLYCSCLFKKTSLAVIAAYLLCLCWLLLVPLIVFNIIPYSVLRNSNSLRNMMLGALLFAALLVGSGLATVTIAVGAMIRRHSLPRIAVIIIWGISLLAVYGTFFISDITRLLNNSLPYRFFDYVFFGNILYLIGGIVEHALDSSVSIAITQDHISTIATPFINIFAALVFTALAVTRLQVQRRGG